MSMILDALRKSEAERRRAQAPDLFAEPAMATPSSTTAYPRRLWWLLATIGLVAAVWFVHSVWTAPERAAAATADVATVTTVEPVARAPVRRAHTGDGVQPSAPSTVPDAANPTPVPAAALPASAAPAITPTAAPQSAQASLPAAPRIATNVASPTSASQPAPVPVVALPSPPREPVPEVFTHSSGGPLRLADLSAEERRQLPPLKMSMHLWNPAAAQRFVILDGARVGEGDRIGDAVVEEITADGAVLAWRGRRLKLPMR